MPVRFLLLLALALLAACAPRATILAPGGTTLELLRSARVIHLGGATKTGDSITIAAQNVHELVILNKFDKAKKITFVVRSQKGTIGLRVFADSPSGGNNRPDLEDFSNNEQKGAKISNPSSKAFYIYLFNRSPQDSSYTFSLVAE